MMDSSTFPHPQSPDSLQVWNQILSGQADEDVSSINATESDDSILDLEDEDDNVVHILASLVQNSGYQLNTEGYQQVPSGEEESGEEDIEWREADSYDRQPKRSKRHGWQSASSSPSPSSTSRSFACEKHSKWKKKCPAECPLRKQHAKTPTTRRKLWTKKESALLVQWADDLVETREPDTAWEDIAKTLNRSVNSTKKKFMRLTNQWSRKSSSPSYSSSRSRTPSSSPLKSSYAKRKRDEESFSEDGSEYDTDMEEDLEEYCELRNERRATVVCEKHRRWKKKCPADCKDKLEESQFAQTVAGGNIKSRQRIAGIVGRPAVSCRRHQLEHQKCPVDCPRRRTVDQYLHDRGRGKATRSSRSSSLSQPPVSPIPQILGSASPSPIPSPSPSQADIANDLSIFPEFQFRRHLHHNSPPEIEGLVPELHWYAPHSTINGEFKVSVGETRVIRKYSSDFSEPEVKLETRRATNFASRTTVPTSDQFLPFSHTYSISLLQNSTSH